MQIDFSPQQQTAIKQVKEWMKTPNSPQIFRFFGYAGTGKTTVAKTIAEELNVSVVYGAFTGKAAQVMRQKGCRDASTIHSMIYDTEVNQYGELNFSLKSHASCDVASAKLCIIDECSMVDEALARDLMSFGTKILVIGDPAQLPPVKGTGFFTDAQPDTMLTEVHRQARENPIIALSMKVREGETLDYGNFGACRVIDKHALSPESVLQTEQVIVGLNRTRILYNKRMRELLKFPSETPVVKDKVICLKNDRKIGIFNGSMWKVHAVKGKKKEQKPTFEMRVEGLDEIEQTRIVNVRREFFTGLEDTIDWKDKKGTQEFTYGYAITCHKSQGSQWKDIMVFNEGGCFREDARRWLYTAITRASESLTLVQ